MLRDYKWLKTKKKIKKTEMQEITVEDNVEKTDYSVEQLLEMAQKLLMNISMQHKEFKQSLKIIKKKLKSS